MAEKIIKAQLSQEKNKFTEILVKHSNRDLTEDDCRKIEEALKGWRKYPYEKPKNTDCIVIYIGKTYKVIWYNDAYELIYRFTHWMPIPEIGE